MVGLDAQTLEHAHVEIAQGRRVLRIEMQVLAVLEPKSGDEFLQSRPKGDGRANSWNSEPTNKGNEDSGNCSHSESAKRLTLRVTAGNHTTHCCFVPFVVFCSIHFPF